MALSLQSITISLLLLLPGLFQLGIADESNEASSKLKLVIASSNNFPPINLLDDEGRLTGFARDLSDAVAEAVDVEVKRIHSNRWPNVLKWLDSGEADLIHDTGYTPEREAYLDFTLPIIEMPESIFVRDQRLDINDFKSLSGKKVACVNKHITHIYLQRFKDIKCHIVSTPLEGLLALIDGSVDAFIYPEQIVLYMAQKLNLDDKIKVVAEPLRILSWSMTVKKGNTKILELLNRGIRQVKKSGEYQTIYDKWFGKRALSGYSRNEVFLIILVTIFIALLIVVSVSSFIYTRGMRKANKELVASEDKFRTLANNLPESVFLKDPDSIYISCNKKYADSLGIKPYEIVGKSDYDFFPDLAELYHEGDRNVMESGKIKEFDEKSVINGKTHYSHIIKTPVYKHNKLAGVLGVIWDITEQRKLQNELNKIVHEYNTITATVPDVMYTLNLNGELVWWNKTFERLTGLNEAELQGKNALDVIAENDREKVAAAIKQTVVKGFAEVEAGFITKNDEVLYVFNGAALRDEDGTVIGLAGSGRDISKQRASEKKQLKLQTQLQHAQKIESIGQLTGGIAHDFNNLLGSILGYSELCIDKLEKDGGIEKVKPKLKKYVEQIHVAGKRGRELVKNMMSFSRVYEGEKVKVDIDAFIDELFSLLRPLIPASIELETQVDDNLPVVVVDPVMVQQMLINLCLNSRDAMSGAGKIVIAATISGLAEQTCDSCHNVFQGEYINISIRDSGEGIAPEIISRIFEPFVTSKEVGKGTGMGLAMVHGITHEHNGHIRVFTKPGDTSFNIYLPLEDSSHIIDDKGNKEEKNIMYDKKHHNILVVDDEQAITMLQEELLSSQGYQVKVAHNGEDAYNLFMQNPDSVDLIISDQTMPVMTGKDLAIKIKESYPEIPFIICTGYTDKLDEAQAKDLGIYAFFRKPVDNYKLIEAIQNYFN